MMKSEVEIRERTARWKITYPLIDEGRFDVESGTWSGYWLMGEYQFRVDFLDGDRVVQAAKASIDPMSLCPRDKYGPIFTKYPRQFIECAPLRPAFIDSDQMQFTIRTIPERVSTCMAVADVTAPRDDTILAGPWTLELHGDALQREFETSGWPRGEYWIRVRLQQDGKPVGPHLIRKVWKEILPSIKLRNRPMRLGHRYQMLTGASDLAAIEGIRFVPDRLVKQPDHPLVIMDKPWETELLYYKSLHFDASNAEFVLEYELAGGDRQRDGERAALPATVCRAVSKDGLSWTKPSLGLVEYRGSRDNNLVPPDKEFVPPRMQGRVDTLLHNCTRAKFRPYDPRDDGPVNMQYVFVTSIKRSFVNQCSDPSSKPYCTGAWPMERRGDTYLVLTQEPLLYSGTGMDLHHSTEQITLHVEDRSTGALYYYFRPGAPSYPPHDAPYDNMHMVRRCLGVVWTKDGVNWERRLIAVPDENDAQGTQLYSNSLYTSEREADSARPAMALENHWSQAAVSEGQQAFCTFTIFDAKRNRLWPELVAMDDLLHWRRFDSRSKFIPNGPSGSYDYGLIKIATSYHHFGNEWWFPYQAINTLHQDYIGLAKVDSVRQLQQQYPNYAEIPGFVDWEQYWQRCKSMRYYTGIARCASGRVCHAEAIAGMGSLQTAPFVLQGSTLLINGIVPANGSLQVELLDEFDKVISGFDQATCRPIEGDSLALTVAWEHGRMSSLQGRVVSLRFLLKGSQLFGYRLQDSRE
ncbi:MAG: hypothetical protein IT427_16850 [Pirellulales bacterium]|nr:hypothetical protein [Pirellulales bacterium]